MRFWVKRVWTGMTATRFRYLPLDGEDDQYSKLITWVDKAVWVNRKVEMYDKKGELEKILEVERLEVVQGYQTPHRYQNEQCSERPLHSSDCEEVCL